MEEHSFALKAQDFSVAGILGRGAFGVVYSCRCDKSGSHVAVKVISKAKAAALGVAARVINEVSLHCKMRHPNIVDLLDFFEDEHNVYLVTEACVGGDMYQYLHRHGPLPVSEVQRLGGQLLSAVAHMHAQGILHRDLKLSNLLLAEVGDHPGEAEAAAPDTAYPTSRFILKVADYGLAVQLSGLPGEEHRTICGTPNYIAPEVTAALPHGPAADVYSAGCLLYCMLFGRPPAQQKVTVTTTPAAHPTGAALVAGSGGAALGSSAAAAGSPGFQTSQSPQPQGSPSVGYVTRTFQAADFASNLERLPPSGAALIRSLLAPFPGDRPMAKGALAHEFFSLRNAALLPAMPAASAAAPGSAKQPSIGSAASPSAIAAALAATATSAAANPLPLMKLSRPESAFGQTLKGTTGSQTTQHAWFSGASAPTAATASAGLGHGRSPIMLPCSSTSAAEGPSDAIPLLPPSVDTDLMLPAQKQAAGTQGSPSNSVGAGPAPLGSPTSSFGKPFPAQQPALSSHGAASQASPGALGLSFMPRERRPSSELEVEQKQSAVVIPMAAPAAAAAVLQASMTPLRVGLSASESSALAQSAAPSASGQLPLPRGSPQQLFHLASPQEHAQQPSSSQPLALSAAPGLSFSSSPLVQYPRPRVASTGSALSSFSAMGSASRQQGPYSPTAAQQAHLAAQGAPPSPSLDSIAPLQGNATVIVGGRTFVASSAAAFGAVPAHPSLYPHHYTIASSASAGDRTIVSLVSASASMEPPPILLPAIPHLPPSLPQHQQQACTQADASSSTPAAVGSASQNGLPQTGARLEPGERLLLQGRVGAPGLVAGLATDYSYAPASKLPTVIESSPPKARPLTGSMPVSQDAATTEAKEADEGAAQALAPVERRAQGASPVILDASGPDRHGSGSISPLPRDFRMEVPSLSVGPLPPFYHASSSGPAHVVGGGAEAVAAITKDPEPSHSNLQLSGGGSGFNVQTAPLMAEARLVENAGATPVITSLGSPGAGAEAGGSRSSAVAIPAAPHSAATRVVANPLPSSLRDLEEYESLVIPRIITPRPPSTQGPRLSPPPQPQAPVSSRGRDHSAQPIELGKRHSAPKERATRSSRSASPLLSGASTEDDSADISMLSAGSSLLEAVFPLVNKNSAPLHQPPRGARQRPSAVADAPAAVVNVPLPMKAASAAEAPAVLSVGPQRDIASSVGPESATHVTVKVSAGSSSASTATFVSTDGSKARAESSVQQLAPAAEATTAAEQEALSYGDDDVASPLPSSASLPPSASVHFGLLSSAAGGPGASQLFSSTHTGQPAQPPQIYTQARSDASSQTRRVSRAAAEVAAALESGPRRSSFGQPSPDLLSVATSAVGEHEASRTFSQLSSSSSLDVQWTLAQLSAGLPTLRTRGSVESQTEQADEPGAGHLALSSDLNASRLVREAAAAANVIADGTSATNGLAGATVAHDTLVRKAQKHLPADNSSARERSEAQRVSQSLHRDNHQSRPSSFADGVRGALLLDQGMRREYAAQRKQEAREAQERAERRTAEDAVRLRIRTGLDKGGLAVLSSIGAASRGRPQPSSAVQGNPAHVGQLAAVATSRGESRDSNAVELAAMRRLLDFGSHAGHLPPAHIPLVMKQSKPAAACDVHEATQLTQTVRIWPLRGVAELCQSRRGPTGSAVVLRFDRRARAGHSIQITKAAAQGTAGSDQLQPRLVLQSDEPLALPLSYARLFRALKAAVGSIRARLPRVAAMNDYQVSVPIAGSAQAFRVTTTAILLDDGPVGNSFTFSLRMTPVSSTGEPQQDPLLWRVRYFPRRDDLVVVGTPAFGGEAHDSSGPSFKAYLKKHPRQPPTSQGSLPSAVLSSSAVTSSSSRSCVSGSASFDSSSYAPDTLPAHAHSPIPALSSLPLHASSLAAIAIRQHASCIAADSAVVPAEPAAKEGAAFPLPVVLKGHEKVVDDATLAVLLRSAGFHGANAARSDATQPVETLLEVADQPSVRVEGAFFLEDDEATVAALRNQKDVGATQLEQLLHDVRLGKFLAVHFSDGSRLLLRDDASSMATLLPISDPRRIAKKAEPSLAIYQLDGSIDLLPPEAAARLIQARTFLKQCLV